MQHRPALLAATEGETDGDDESGQQVPVPDPTTLHVLRLAGAGPRCRGGARQKEEPGRCRRGRQQRPGLERRYRNVAKGSTRQATVYLNAG